MLLTLSWSSLVRSDFVLTPSYRSWPNRTKFFSDRSLRVHYVIDQYEPLAGGTETQLRLLLAGMANAGHEVRLFVFRPTPFSRRPEGFPCPIECLEVGSLTSANSLAALRAFRRRLAKDHPAVVHAFFNDAAIAVPLTSVALPVRVLSSRRDLGFWYTPAVLTALRIANQRVDLVVCNCEAVRNEVVKRESLHPARTRVIYNAAPSPSPKTAAHASDEVQICLVANARPLKRIEDLIQAAQLVRQSNLTCRYKVVGKVPDDDYGRSLRSLVSQLGLQDCFEFLGSSSNPSQVLETSDIGVLTSSSEGFSNSIMEYMRCGLPVVCSIAGGNPELVRNEQEGLLYPTGDVAALANRLSMLAANPLLRSTLGQRGRQRIQEYSVQRMVDKHIAAYEGK